MADALDAFHIEIIVANKNEVMAQKVGNWWGVSFAANYMVSEDTFANKIADKLVGILPEKMKAMGLEMSVKRQKEEEPAGLCSVFLEVPPRHPTVRLLATSPPRRLRCSSSALTLRSWRRRA